MAEDTRNQSGEQDRSRGGSEESRGIYEADKDQTWVFEHDDANPNNAAVTNVDRNDSDRSSDRDSDRNSDQDRESSR
jgi:hypothetical protein